MSRKKVAAIAAAISAIATTIAETLTVTGTFLEAIARHLG